MVELPAQVEAIVMNASGCGVTVKEYGHILRDDPAYADKAAAHQRADPRPERIAARHRGRAASRTTCQRQRRAAHAAGVPPALHAAARPAAARRRRDSTWARWASTCSVARSEAHLCCGSAGTYSVLQPELAYQLRDRKLGHLGAAASADVIVVGQHRLHHASAKRHTDAGAALGRGAGRAPALTAPGVWRREGWHDGGFSYDRRCHDRHRSRTRTIPRDAGPRSGHASKRGCVRRRRGCQPGSGVGATGGQWQHPGWPSQGDITAPRARAATGWRADAASCAHGSGACVACHATGAGATG